MLQPLENFRGLTLHARDGELGRIEDFRFDHQWTVRYLVVRTGTWFGRHVLISPISTAQADWVDGRLDVRLTRGQIRNSPEVPPGTPISRETERAYARYYGYPAYWAGPHLWAWAPTPGELDSTPPEDYTPLERDDIAVGDRSLRSVQALRGQHVNARDGDVGHVEDGIIDDQTWHIAYLLIDTSHWFAGQRMLVPTALVRDVAWTKWIAIEATRDQIQSAPRYDTAQPLDRTVSDALSRHYGLPTVAPSARARSASRSR